MVSLLESVRGTVQGVLEAFGHVAWFVSWHTRAPGAPRGCRSNDGQSV